MIVSVEDEARDFQTFRSTKQFWDIVLRQVLQLIRSNNNMGSGKLTFRLVRLSSKVTLD